MKLTHKIAFLALAAAMLTGCNPQTMARYAEHKDANADSQSTTANNNGPKFDDGTVPGQATVMNTGEHAGEPAQLEPNSNQIADQAQQAYNQSGGPQTQQPAQGDQPIEAAPDSPPKPQAQTSPAASSATSTPTDIPGAPTASAPNQESAPASANQAAPNPAAGAPAPVAGAQPSSAPTPDGL